MILMINGSFGVGKTTVAEALVQRLENAVIFDPEYAGFYLRRVFEAFGPPDDFQDYPQWRELTIATAKWIRETYGRDIVMPMCLWREDYFREIVEGISPFEPNLLHFCLTAPEEVIHARLKQRGDEDDAWSHKMVERCVRAHASGLFEEKIDTANRPAAAVVEDIVARVRKSNFEGLGTPIGRQ